MLSRQAIRGAHSAAAQATKASKGEQVTKLNNGLTVASVDNSGALSQLVLAFRAGSRYETNAQAGLVHHLRNAVGTDSQKYPGTSLVWSTAAAGGNLISFATRDVFGVALTVPRDQSSVALSILGHIAASPAHKPWEVEKIYDSLRADNAYKQAYNVVFEDIHRAAYRNGSLARSTFAAKHQIGKICHNGLQRYTAEHLVAGQAVLFGSNIEHERLVIYGDSHAPIQAGSGKSAEASPYKGGEYRRNGAGSMAHVILAGQGAAGNDVKGLATQAVLLSALGRDASVRFSNVAGNGVVAKAVGEQGAVSSFQAVHQDTSLAGVYIVADGAKIADVVSTAVNAFKNFKVGNIDVAKTRAANDLLRASAHSLEMSIERSSQLLSGVQDGAIVQAVSQVSAADVEAAAKKIASRLSISSYGAIHQVPFVDSL